MRRLLPVALVSVLTLTAPALAEHGPDSRVVVNVQTAGNHGCSTDSWTAPDLRVRVWHDGRVVAETSKAQDTHDPAWLDVFEFDLAPDARTVSLEVQEAEPGGFFISGTTWVQCDASPGPGAWANVTVRDAAVSVTSRGTASAASVTARVAPAHAPHLTRPVVELDDFTDGVATVKWNVAPGLDEEATQTLRMNRGDAWTVPAGVSTWRIPDMNENGEYSFRLERETEGWRAASAWQRIRMPNAPPPVAETHVTAGEGYVHVSWRAEARDLTDVEVHASRFSGFVPNDQTLQTTDRARGGESANQTTLVSFPPNEPVFIRVVTVDAWGARTPSPEVQATPEPMDVPEGDAPAVNDSTSGVHAPTPRVTMLDGGAALEWEPLPGARAVEVWAREVGEPYQRAVTLHGTATRTTVHGLTGGASAQFMLRVHDADGGVVEGSPTTPRLVPAPNVPPVAALSLCESRVPLNASVCADATASTDADGDALTYEWDWGDGAWARGPARAEHAYHAPGYFTVRVRVTDPDGAVDEATAVVFVEQAPPVALDAAGNEAARDVPGAATALLVPCASVTALLVARRRGGAGPRARI